ncbi:multicopper oxidase [Trametes coccinea BRFM310]|uniref:laccase n=1 Tax=Trametes coccinea (strain BRFM310) TaxID=1353009 RepID=A0A1Y2INT4_TRAC3|nr:multicopper oxidase [Trametes coccinea BRFM310]
MEGSRSTFLHMFSSLVVTISLAISVFAGIGPVTDLTISNADVSPDGYQRAAVVANGVMPGPLITGQKGDEFKINVINNLTNHTMLKSTSIHWHGLFQRSTNWADGPAFVNQCPIATGHSFLYDFHVPDQAGTFWYHSHLSTQYCDGLRGPLVVYDPNDPHADLYDVDNDDTVITLADWYHAAAKVGPKFPVRTDSTLINGRGRTAATIAAELTVITVTPGKRYRFRLVSISCDPAYTFSIDGHDMTVIEADSVNTQPLEVDSIPIYAGQRYSFVVEANQPVDNYWIRANPMAGTTGFEGGINSAILRYEGAPEQEPTTTPSTSTKPLKETDLHPLVSMPVPGSPVAGGVDKAINMAFQFDGTNFFINGATFKPPTTPVLLQILSGAQAASDLLPSGDVYVLPSNATIELSFPATIQAGAPHPFHLHGHTFAVVRSAGSTEYNYENPIFRDVVSTGVPEDSDNVTIRFRTDNPGPWFLHCHIDFHLEAGFAVIMAEDTPDTKTDNPVPQSWSDLCPIYDALDPSDQ